MKRLLLVATLLLGCTVLAADDNKLTFNKLQIGDRVWDYHQAIFCNKPAKVQREDWTFTFIVSELIDVNSDDYEKLLNLSIRSSKGHKIFRLPKEASFSVLCEGNDYVVIDGDGNRHAAHVYASPQHRKYK